MNIGDVMAMIVIVVLGGSLCFNIMREHKHPGLYKIKCADTNGNITIDTEVDALDFVADDLTFKFKRVDGKYFVVSGFCFVEEQ